MLWSILFEQRRSIHADALALAANLEPPLHILGGRNIPSRGPCVITVNHYTRPGFPSWWIALAVSAVVSSDIHWVMTAAWVFPCQPLKHYTITPITRWIFRRIAYVYGFTLMPPMPPEPDEVIERASAVRRVLKFVRYTPDALIGLAPEGGDSTMSALTTPPGVGRFLLHLADLGLVLTPVGVYEAEERLCVHFGPTYRLSIPSYLPSKERDQQASREAMRAIARLLPVDLRGEFWTG